MVESIGARIPERVKTLFDRTLASGELTDELRAEVLELSDPEQNMFLALTSIRLILAIEHVESTLDDCDGEERKRRERQLQEAGELVDQQVAMLQEQTADY